MTQQQLMEGAISFYLEQVVAAEHAYYLNPMVVVRDPVLILANCVTEAARALDLRFVGHTPEGAEARQVLVAIARQRAIEIMKARGMWR